MREPTSNTAPDQDMGARCQGGEAHLTAGDPGEDTEHTAVGARRPGGHRQRFLQQLTAKVQGGQGSKAGSLLPSPRLHGSPSSGDPGHTPREEGRMRVRRRVLAERRINPELMMLNRKYPSIRVSWNWQSLSAVAEMVAHEPHLGIEK